MESIDLKILFFLIMKNLIRFIDSSFGIGGKLKKNWKDIILWDELQRWVEWASLPEVELSRNISNDLTHRMRNGMT